MTAQELRFDMDHVRQMLDGHPATDGLRNRYIKSWEKWLAWCQDRGVHPGQAGIDDVAGFIASLPASARGYVQTDVRRIYSLLGTGNPARRLRPLSPGGRKSHDKRWRAWLFWCELKSAVPLPADPRLVAEYLEEKADKVSARTAEWAASTISRMHIENALPDPQHTAPVARALARIKEQVLRHTPQQRTHTGESPQTVKRTEGIWMRWSRWCGGEGVDPMSAQPGDLVAFLRLKKNSGSYHYLQMLRRTLRAIYQQEGVAPNPADSALVREAMKELKDSDRPTGGEGIQGLPPGDAPGFPVPDELEHLAPRTRKTYRSYWRSWSQWCGEEGIAPLGASAQQLVDFLKVKAERLSMKSVELYVAAIACVYDVNDPDGTNPAHAKLVSRKLKALKREKGKRPAQMTGLSAEGFARIQAMARRPQPWETEKQARVRGTKDLAIIGVMRDGLLRVGEAAALTWNDLTEEADGTGCLYIARSKSDQEGRGATVFVSRPTMRWLQEMREMMMEQATMFGLGRGQIYLRIIDAARYAGLPGRYGGHSMRIGMAQDLARGNTSMPMLMNAGRWEKAETVMDYIREIAAGQNAVADWYTQHPGRALIE